MVQNRSPYQVKRDKAIMERMARAKTNKDNFLFCPNCQSYQGTWAKTKTCKGCGKQLGNLYKEK